MAAAAARDKLEMLRYEWARSSLLHSSPHASSMYPDRPIRPLPKRSLRARLSPEQAETIEFPYHPPSTGPLFNFPYSASERGNRALRTGENDHHACHCGHTHSEIESEEEGDERRGVLSSPTYPYGRHGSGKLVTGVPAAYNKTGSAASSIDGYESFENTNNKKKRKIPNMGGGGAHHASQSADRANLGIAQAREAPIVDDADGLGRHYGSLPSTPHHYVSYTGTGTGISGAGRGRFGRSNSARSERRVVGNPASLVNGKASSSKSSSEQGGIISTAIANAQATPPAISRENMSLLQQEATKPGATKTQFTFTCGSDSANKMIWPSQENGACPQPPGAYPSATATTAAPLPAHVGRSRPPFRPDIPLVSTKGTQTSPNMNGSATYPVANRTVPLPKGSQAQQQAPPPRKPIRSASKLYAHAARKRRIQQEYTNFHNPPSQPWICEFCEYEDIFGLVPKALIRQYEIKDRKERRRLAEKRRLLEKARMKGRKGGKTSKKTQSKTNNVPHNQQPVRGGYDRRDDDASLDPQDDEYYEDDYDDAPAASMSHCQYGCSCQHHPNPPRLPPQKVPGLSPGDPRVCGPPVPPVLTGA